MTDAWEHKRLVIPFVAFIATVPSTVADSDSEKLMAIVAPWSIDRAKLAVERVVRTQQLEMLVKGSVNLINRPAPNYVYSQSSNKQGIKNYRKT